MMGRGKATELRGRLGRRRDALRRDRRLGGPARRHLGSSHARAHRMASKKVKDEDKALAKAPDQVSVRNHDGSFSDLAERFFALRSWLTPVVDQEGGFHLYANLSVNAAEVAIKDHLIEVKAVRAFLIFSLDGLTDDPREPRYGSLALEADHRTKVETKVTTAGTLSGRAGAKGTLTPVGPLGSVSAEVSARGERSFISTEKDKFEPVARRIIARPNCEWEFQEPTGAALNGDYLDKARLSTLRRTQGANRTRVMGRLHVRQRDLRFNHDDAGLIERTMTSKQRMLDIFMAKYISGDPSNRGPGVIFVSRVEIEL